MDRIEVNWAQHAAPLQRESRGLFDDDADEFLFSGAKEKFGGFAEVDVFAWIVDGYAIDFHGFLLDEALGFRLRWGHF